jgi:hypothetical protein
MLFVLSITLYISEMDDFQRKANPIVTLDGDIIHFVDAENYILPL